MVLPNRRISHGSLCILPSSPYKVLLKLGHSPSLLRFLNKTYQACPPNGQAGLSEPCSDRPLLRPWQKLPPGRVTPPQPFAHWLWWSQFPKYVCFHFTFDLCGSVWYAQWLTKFSMYRFLILIRHWRPWAQRGHWRVKSSQDRKDFRSRSNHSGVHWRGSQPRGTPQDPREICQGTHVLFQGIRRERYT